MNGESSGAVAVLGRAFAAAARAESVRASAWRQLLVWWAISRAVVFGCVLVLQSSQHPRGYGFFGPEVFSNLAALGSWDGRWYRIVAQHGYLLISGRQSDPAFFPLYPMLLRGVHATGLSYVAGGVLLSNAFFLLALVLLYELGRTLVPEPDARRAASYLAVFPISYVCSMVYPQSLVLVCITGAGLAAFRRRWLLAGVCVAAGTLARPEALFVALPIALLAARRWRELGGRERGLAVGAVLAGPVALASFSAYLGWALGDALAWSHAQVEWGRRFTTFGIVDAFTGFGTDWHQWGWAWRDLGFFCTYVALLAVAWRAGVARGWIGAALLTLLIPLGSGTVVSEARFGLLCVAVYWGLAVLGRRRAVDVVVRAGSLGLMAAAVLTLPFAYP